MIGQLTGVVLSVTPSERGVVVRLAGISDPAGGVRLTWIHAVEFAQRLVPRDVLVVGRAVVVKCQAAQHTFTGRDGQAAGQVRLLGTGACSLQGGRVVTRGTTPFLEGAVNEFFSRGFLVSAPERHANGKVTARVGVQGRTKVHYFKLEAWRGEADQLLGLRKAAEVDVSVALRRDRGDRQGQVVTYDVMEVRRITRAPAAGPAAPRALQAA